MKKIISKVMAVTMGLTLLAGCARGTTATTAAGTQAGTTTAAAGTQGNGGEKIKVGILLKTLANPFWVDMAEGIKAEAAAKNIEVEILAMESEQEVEGQLKKMEDMVNSGAYDGIGIAPITGTNLISGVVLANSKGIPVVNIDAKIDEEALTAAGGHVIGFATSDNKKVGQMGAEYIMTEKPEGAKVAIIEGRAGDLSGELRRDGAKEAFATDSKFEVVDVQPADWDRQKALDVATNIITKTPDLGAFFVANDTMALGVLQAIENTNNLDNIVLVGTDASDETRAAIAAGKMTAVVQSPANIGKTCFNILVDAIEKGEAGSADYTPVETLVEAELVTE